MEQRERTGNADWPEHVVFEREHADALSFDQFHDVTGGHVHPVLHIGLAFHVLREKGQEIAEFNAVVHGGTESFPGNQQTGAGHSQSYDQKDDQSDSDQQQKNRNFHKKIPASCLIFLNITANFIPNL